MWSTTPALAAAIKQLPVDLLPALINAAYSLPYKSLESFLSLLTSSPAPSHLDLATSLSALQTTPTSASYGHAMLYDDLPPSVMRVQEGSVASFPLRLSHVESYLGQPKDGRDLRTALVGDAAHTIHPLAGQGLNMGLGDIQALVKTLETTVADGGDVGASDYRTRAGQELTFHYFIGQYTNLRSYPRARYIPNHAVLSTCDHLSSLYSSKFAPIVWARSTGLETVNELDGLKNLLMGGAGSRVSAETNNRRSAGKWGVVADGIEKVRSGVEVAKAVGGLVAAQLRNRLEYMVKR